MRTIARASAPLIAHQMARRGKFSGSEVKMKEEAVIFFLFYFFCFLVILSWALLVAQLVKNLSAMQETWV